MYRYTCPTCRKEIEVAERADAPFRPFCCERCKLIDLGKWFNEEYRISDSLPQADTDNPVESEDPGD